MLTVEEKRTWIAVVPIVFFMYVRMHHVDRVKRRLGGEQQVPEDPLSVRGERTSTSRLGISSGMMTGEPGSQPSVRSRSPLRSIRSCRYSSTLSGGRRHAQFGFFPLLMRFMILVWMLFLMTFQALLLSLWSSYLCRGMCRLRPRIVGMQFRPNIRRQAHGGCGRGAVGEPQRPIGAIDFEEEPQRPCA
ncbi:hypothetical protein PIB30_035423 [Stylosanthes scabra]|uniref:Uncharacterized protein n=1 Tax=Stylosanthes scabra TaxID=79078 RepID=A0ABU6RDB2_9FABA|nr:hypothetical protein [Stylosanthes scabra]